MPPTSATPPSTRQIRDEALVLSEAIVEAAAHLATGGTVAMPTETVYGLAARTDSAEGINAIFRLKKRPSFDPLIVHVSSIDQVADVANEWPPLAQTLAEKFWPGPLTLVVKKKPSLNSMITAGLDTVGIRMPNHEIALALIKAAGHPLAAPSANRFGRTSPTSAQHVRAEFSDQIESSEILLLDGGECDIGVESTVCLVLLDSLIILRPGGITEEEIRKHLQQTEEFKSVALSREAGHQASPGHTEHHYETRKPLIVSWSEAFGARPSYDVSGTRISRDKILELKLSEDPALAARELYARLRAGDEHPNSVALFLRREHDHSGLWRAIDDRLMRAARLQIGKAPSLDV